ncbi:hypothetical protein M0R45_017256 [Rubus argutus]|uniref:Uncharacterized protein n=1 Tax=Rubus argutus TaxID=59490 RepID=A0AAW1XXT0_RUBAR
MSPRFTVASVFPPASLTQLRFHRRRPPNRHKPPLTSNPSCHRSQVKSSSVRCRDQPSSPRRHHDFDCLHHHLTQLLLPPVSSSIKTTTAPPSFTTHRSNHIEPVLDLCSSGHRRHLPMEGRESWCAWKREMRDLN